MQPPLRQITCPPAPSQSIAHTKWQYLCSSNVVWRAAAGRQQQQWQGIGGSKSVGWRWWRIIGALAAEGHWWWRGVGGRGALAVVLAPPPMLMLCWACVAWLMLLGSTHCGGTKVLCGTDGEHFSNLPLATGQQ